MLLSDLSLLFYKDSILSKHPTQIMLIIRKIPFDYGEKLT